MAKHKTSSEWDRIELEYLAGECSIREIADRHEISEAAIRRRAKIQRWVRAARKPRTLRTSPNPPPPPAAPAEPVDAPAIAERGRQLVVRMLDELDTVTSNIGQLEEMVYDDTDDDRDGGRREGMLKALSLGSRALTVKTLAAAFKTLNEASAPQGKKAQAQDRAKAVGGGSRFAPIGPPRLAVVKP